ncbi:MULTISPECIES: hypothetical protein [Roseobacteraceae]|uniref:Uncharacterized protein n=1 Tax=Pseudosulfitobacter pseudonitzschiae TaxID=1402135 RepID=A0A221K3Q5_9RHOB|nr:MULTISPECIES: hypothetical protein [Roseobacteraceae]ASM73477.1 hypothetical protein SULPSESMR1_02682 [Pseudosulfitobacter pseudonitzschiae]
MKSVVCPVALHPDGAPRRLAIATHPQIALVHSTLPQAARPENAAAQALFAVGGLETRAALLLGTSDNIVKAERWHFALCRTVPPVRDLWQNADPDGELRRFGWLALDGTAPDDIAQVYQRALDWIRGAL